ncbi:MAG: hypothetical protein QXU98_12085 [Candidatus Parvarchaeota archaeon]
MSSRYISASIPVPDWKILKGKPYITVSPKGISNGLSNIPNDGADFGPDTLLGASSPSQYGPPYTQTSGWQEAINFASATTISSPTYGGTVMAAYAVRGLPGVHKIYTTIMLPDIQMDIGGYGNETILQAQTSGMTIMKLTTGSSDYVRGEHIHDMSFDGNSLANTGLDMTQTSPEASNASVFERLWFTDTFSSSNYKMIMNGQADCFLNQINFSTGTNAAQQDLLWESGGSGGYFSQCHSLAKVGFVITLQQATFVQCLFGNVTVNGTTEQLLFQDCYFLSGMSQASILISGNYYLPVIIFDGTFLAITPTQPLLNWNYNYPKIDSVIFRGCIISWDTSSAAPLLTGNASFTIFGVKSLTVEGCTANFSTLANAQTPDFSFVPSSAGGDNYLMTLTAETLVAPTSGGIVIHQIAFTPNYKKVMFIFEAYENDTTTNQNVNYPFSFASEAYISSNTTGLTFTVGLQVLTIVAPNNTTQYTGIVVVEGY